MTSLKFSKILDRHIKRLDKERKEEIKFHPKDAAWYDSRIAQFQKISKLVKQGNAEQAFAEWNKMEVHDTIDTTLQPIITWLETQMGDYLLGTTGSQRDDRELRTNAETWGFLSAPHVERARKRLGILQPNGVK